MELQAQAQAEERKLQMQMQAEAEWEQRQFELRKLELQRAQYRHVETYLPNFGSKMLQVTLQNLMAMILRHFSFLLRKLQV